MAFLHSFRQTVSYLPWIAIGVGSAYSLYELWVQRKFIKILLNKEERERYFANLTAMVAEEHNRKTHYEKLHLFEQLKEVKGGIKVLEIGAGSGANLQFYPPNTSLTVIEPNPYSKDILLRNLEKYPWVKLESYFAEAVEKIRDLIEAGTFDFVVTTLVACSVTDPNSLYSAVKFALKPGGKYLYMEHIYQPSWTSPIHYVQLFFDISGIWSIIYDGCHLTRSLDKIVLHQGFAHVRQKTFNIDVPKGDFWAWKYVKLHVAGTASTAV